MHIKNATFSTSKPLSLVGPTDVFQFTEAHVADLAKSLSREPEYFRGFFMVYTALISGDFVSIVNVDSDGRDYLIQAPRHFQVRVVTSAEFQQS